MGCLQGRLETTVRTRPKRQLPGLEAPGELEAKEFKVKQLMMAFYKFGVAENERNIMAE